MADYPEPSTLTELFATLRRARRAEEVTLKEVAAKTGVTLQAIQQYETGSTNRYPSEVVMRKWLGALELPRSWADLYVEMRKLHDIDAILSTMNLPAEQLSAQRVSLRNALRVKHERR